MQKEGIDQKIEGWQQVIIKDNGGHDSTDIKNDQRIICNC